jgi:hypothetical protein
MTHRRYSLLLIGMALAIVIGFGLYGRTFEPLTGDLTRIGWYDETAFGWHQPDHRFIPPLAEAGRLDGAYDIVAIGDSFTVDEADRIGADWPHFLARDTGLRIGVFDSGIDPLDKLLASPVYRAHPPAALVYEIVERSFVPEHRGGGTAKCAASSTTPRAGLAIAPRAVAPAPVIRTTRWKWDDWPASYAINYVLQNTLRRLRGHETTTAVRLEMIEDGLFSSRHERGLLVYAEDFNKLNWRSADWDAAICDLMRLQDRVQANGHTAFLAMVVPDKLTVYAPFLPERPFDGLSHLDRLEDAATLNLVRLDGALDPRRHVDLYLPDDTHWSSAGYDIAARLVLDQMLARGILRRPSP